MWSQCNSTVWWRWKHNLSWNWMHETEIERFNGIQRRSIWGCHLMMKWNRWWWRLIKWNCKNKTSITNIPFSKTHFFSKYRSFDDMAYALLVDQNSIGVGFVVNSLCLHDFDTLAVILVVYSHLLNDMIFDDFHPSNDLVIYLFWNFFSLYIDDCLVFSNFYSENVLHR